MFTEKFGRYACDGESIACTVDGFKVTARIEHDDCGDKPWERDCGHGPVSKWTRRAKAPGERILSEDRDWRRYYDFAEAVKIARRDGWDTEPYGQGTAGQRAARAAEADFRVLRAWCNDDWWYVGIVVTASKNGIELVRPYDVALWGIECNVPGSDNSYLTEVANELLAEAVDRARDALASLCECEPA